MPTRDHVPELMNASFSCGKGMPATAAPVSWQAGAMTCTFDRPRSVASSLRIFPSGVPGETQFFLRSARDSLIRGW